MIVKTWCFCISQTSNIYLKYIVGSCIKLNFFYISTITLDTAAREVLSKKYFPQIFLGKIFQILFCNFPIILSVKYY